MVNKQPEALRLAQHINDLFVSQWGMNNPMAKDSKIVLDELRRLHAEVEALKPDAARYRAIRKGLEIDPDNSGIVVSLIDDFGGETLRDEIADAAIDAADAMLKAREQK